MARMLVVWKSENLVDRRQRRTYTVRKISPIATTETRVGVVKPQLAKPPPVIVLPF